MTIKAAKRVSRHPGFCFEDCCELRQFDREALLDKARTRCKKASKLQAGGRQEERHKLEAAIFVTGHSVGRRPSIRWGRAAAMVSPC